MRGLGPADVLHLDLSTGELRSSLYGSGASTAAEGVDAIELRGVEPERLEADGSAVTVELEIALPVRLEDRAGRAVAVLEDAKRTASGRTH